MKRSKFGFLAAIHVDSLSLEHCGWIAGGRGKPIGTLHYPSSPATLYSYHFYFFLPRMGRRAWEAIYLGCQPLKTFMFAAIN